MFFFFFFIYTYNIIQSLKDIFYMIALFFPSIYWKKRSTAIASANISLYYPGSDIFDMDCVFSGCDCCECMKSSSWLK